MNNTEKPIGDIETDYKIPSYLGMLIKEFYSGKYDKMTIRAFRETMVDLHNSYVMLSHETMPLCAKYPTCGSTDLFPCSTCTNYEKPNIERNE